MSSSTAPWDNRPFKFGSRDRREFIVSDTEIALRAINDTNGNPIFLAWAKAGSAESSAIWQLRKIQYDSNQGVTSVTWSENPDGIPTTNYEFVYASTSDLTVTGVTNANPAVVTVSSIGTLQNGDLVIFQGISGMTELNFDGSNIYTVANIAGSTFELSGIDSSAYGVYVSGGTANFSEVVNYTYG